jgi:hypothetical protein
MQASGIMTKAAHEKITLRHMGKAVPAAAVTPMGKK